MKVEILSYPNENDWKICKICALNTIGKSIVNNPDDIWKEKIIKSEHSPIRTLNFCIKMEIPYYVSVHFSRHFVGVSHFVQSQRNDRQDKYDRTKQPQDAMVSHIMYINAQALINVAHKRLCSQASEETRKIMQEITKQIVNLCPYMKEVLVPNCVYRGGKCTEFFPCGANKEK